MKKALKRTVLSLSVPFCPFLPLSVLMARPLTAIRRRRGLKMIVGLGLGYFLVMYGFHVSLQDTGGQGRGRSDGGDWDRMAIGGDAAAAVRRRHAGAPGDDDDDGRQREFDRMRQLERRKSVDSDVIEAAAEARVVEKEGDDDGRLEFRREEKTMTSESFDDVNVPRNCRDVHREAEFRFRKIASEVFLYSAFWDSRPNDFDNRRNGSFVRIMAIRPRSAQPTLGCLFDQESAASLNASRALKSPVAYYEMCENHGRGLGGYILSCPVPPELESSPTCSVIVAHVTGDAVSEAVRLRVRTVAPAPLAARRRFAVCVPPLFGAVAVSRLTEFLELSRLLGAEHVTMYDLDMTSEVRAVLRYYETRTGFVSVVPWRLDRSVDEGIWYHGQLVAIQDCLYRSMATADYVVFNDIDEFVVPRGTHFRWPDILPVLDRPNRCAFQFRSAFFKPEGGDRHDLDLDLRTLVHLQRTSNFDRVRTKCMVKTAAIFEKGIHHVSKPIWADLEVHRVDPDVAFLHHYRVCLHGMGMNCAAYEEDRTMLRYEHHLMSAVNYTKLHFKDDATL